MSGDGLKFEFVWAVMHANPEIAYLIHLYKYEKMLWIEALFERFLRDRAVKKSAFGEVIALCQCRFIRYSFESADAIKLSQ